MSITEPKPGTAPFPRRQLMTVADLELFESIAATLHSGLSSTLSWMAYRAMPLPAGNLIQQRMDALKELNAAAGRAKTSFAGQQAGIARTISFDLDQAKLMLYMLDHEISEQRERRAETNKRSKNPEFLRVHDERLSRLEGVRNWDLFRGIEPLPEVGILNYMAPKEVLRLDAEHRALLASFGDRDGEYGSQGDMKDSEDEQLHRRFGTNRKGLARLLRWIKHDRTRKAIYRDIRQASFLLDVDGDLDLAKPALILAGACAEELLRQRILLGGGAAAAIDAAFRMVYPNKKLKTVDVYTFEELIDVAAELKLVDRAHSKMLHGVRDFRNFVHIQAETKQAPIKRQHAEIAVRAAHSLITPK